MKIELFVFLALINLCIWKVSTWFANARRRLKKENKMTWEPKNKLDDEDVDVSDDDDRDHSFNRDDKSGGEREKFKYLLSINDRLNGGGLSAVYRRPLRQRLVAPGRARPLNTKDHSALTCNT